MEVEVIVDAVKKMFEETEVVYDDIGWHEATKYLAVVMSKEEIKYWSPKELFSFKKEAHIYVTNLEGKYKLYKF